MATITLLRCQHCCKPTAMPGCHTKSTASKTAASHKSKQEATTAAVRLLQRVITTANLLLLYDFFFFQWECYYCCYATSAASLLPLQTCCCYVGWQTNNHCRRTSSSQPSRSTSHTDWLAVDILLLLCKQPYSFATPTVTSTTTTAKLCSLVARSCLHFWGRFSDRLRTKHRFLQP